MPAIVLPVVGERDHLACLFGFGQLGVCVDHLLGGVVLGEERQHRAGALRAGRDVVFLQRDVGAVVADRVEVEVEPLLAGREPELAHPAGHARQELLAGGAPRAVGVAGQVGGFRECGQSHQQRETGVISERVRVACARGPRALV